ncbi:MAG: hypothetical protein EOP02_40915 [Proteobacteria bacterium]|nr:MAG: hypothetical protein EOP02_40915 [Pseudomonadota bacterium]
MTETYEMESVLSPGKVTRVDAAKYEAMKEAYLSQEYFPEGATAGWWRKGVQLDLEAKGIIGRTLKKPMRFFRL